MLDLPKWVTTQPLKGSDGQVKWARQIRAKQAMLLQRATPRVLAVGIRPWIKLEHMEAMGCVTERHCMMLVHGVARYAVSCPDAKWWIEHRDDNPTKWLPDAYLHCMEHWSVTKPFK